MKTMRRTSRTSIKGATLISALWRDPPPSDIAMCLLLAVWTPPMEQQFRGYSIQTFGTTAPVVGLLTPPILIVTGWLPLM